MTLDEALSIYELVWGDILLYLGHDWRPGERAFCRELALALGYKPDFSRISLEQSAFIAIRDLKQRREWSRDDDLKQQEAVDLRIRGPAR